MLRWYSSLSFTLDVGKYNMAKEIILFILAAGLFAQGCSTATLKITPVVQPNQRMEYNNGNIELISEKQNAVLVTLLTPECDSKTLPSFYVAIANRGSESFNFSTGNIDASITDTILHVWTYEDMKRKIEKDASDMTLLSIGLILAEGGSSYGYNPNQAYPQTNYSGLLHSTSSINESRTVAIKALDSVLRENTVDPKEVVGGIVKIDRPPYTTKTEILLLKIETPFDEHEFYFDYMFLK